MCAQKKTKKKTCFYPIWVLPKPRVGEFKIYYVRIARSFERREPVGTKHRIINQQRTTFSWAFILVIIIIWRKKKPRDIGVREREKTKIYIRKPSSNFVLRICLSCLTQNLFLSLSLSFSAWAQGGLCVCSRCYLLPVCTHTDTQVCAWIARGQFTAFGGKLTFQSLPSTGNRRHKCSTVGVRVPVRVPIC